MAGRAVDEGHRLSALPGLHLAGRWSRVAGVPPLLRWFQRAILTGTLLGGVFRERRSCCADVQV